MILLFFNWWVKESQQIKEKNDIIYNIVSSELQEPEEINYEKIIHQYYHYIFSWKLQDAYKLKVDAYAWKWEESISFKNFQLQYTFENKLEYIIEKIVEKENIYEVELLTINTIDDSMIKYIVGFEFQGKLLLTKYVNTINHEVLDTFKVPWWLVTVEWESGVKKLYIDTNGSKKPVLSKKIFFDTYNDRYDYVSYLYTYNNFELKDNNTILKFDAYEWEQANFYEYNLLDNTLSNKLSYYDID